MSKVSSILVSRIPVDVDLKTVTYSTEWRHRLRVYSVSMERSDKWALWILTTTYIQIVSMNQHVLFYDWSNCRYPNSDCWIWRVGGPSTCCNNSSGVLMRLSLLEDVQQGCTWLVKLNSRKQAIRWHDSRRYNWRGAILSFSSIRRCDRSGDNQNRRFIFERIWLLSLCNSKRCYWRNSRFEWKDVSSCTI